jgi:mono/diheme cytochrome c family protein
VSVNSKFDRAGCARCHGTNAHISDGVHNTGLDAFLGTLTDDTFLTDVKFSNPFAR